MFEFSVTLICPFSVLSNMSKYVFFINEIKYYHTFIKIYFPVIYSNIFHIIIVLLYYIIFFKFACVKWETVLQLDFHLLHNSLQCPLGVTHLLIQLKKVVSLFIAKTFSINMSAIPGIDFSQHLPLPLRFLSCQNITNRTAAWIWDVN